MKTLLLYLGTALLLSSCYQRIGDLTMISNRNVNLNEEYVLLQSNVEAKARMKNNDALEQAIDKLTKEHYGEYLMNAQVYVKENGKIIKVVGDVWGYKEGSKFAPTRETTSDALFSKGDKVSFTKKDIVYEGTILEVLGETARIEYTDNENQRKTRRLLFRDMTKIENN